MMPANFELAIERLGDVSLFREFVGYYYDDYPQLLGELRVAAENHDARRVHHAAHALKGLVASLGAEVVVALAAAIEQRGRRGDLANLDGMLGALEHEIVRLNNELTSAIG